MQKVLKRVSDDQLRAYIVWLPMFPGDSKNWAKTRSGEFTDQRLTYYWDDNRLTGQQWQKVLGISETAWDVYFLYGANARWDKEPPAPDFWMHQLQGTINAPRLNQPAFEAKLKQLVNQMKRQNS
jgi:hypothetical protein